MILADLNLVASLFMYEWSINNDLTEFRSDKHYFSMEGNWKLYIQGDKVF